MRIFGSPERPASHSYEPRSKGNFRRSGGLVLAALAAGSGIGYGVARNTPAKQPQAVPELQAPATTTTLNATPVSIAPVEALIPDQTDYLTPESTTSTTTTIKAPTTTTTIRRSPSTTSGPLTGPTPTTQVVIRPPQPTVASTSTTMPATTTSISPAS